MVNHPRHITVRIREHRTDILDEDGTVTLTAVAPTRTAAERWLRREVLRRATGDTAVVGEATEYEDDPQDGPVPIAYGHLAENDQVVEWWTP